MSIAAMEFNTQSEAPEWAISQIGQQVILTDDQDFYGDGSLVFKAGQVGTLDAIEASPGGPVAIVEFEGKPQVYVDVPFSKLIRDLDFFLRIPGRAGELALLWKHGLDVKTRLATRTYFRVKKDLLAFGLDISKPYDINSLPVTK